MINGNTSLSETAHTVVQRIKALRVLTQRTGIQTIEDQHDILLTLSNEDMLIVAAELDIRAAVSR